MWLLSLLCLSGRVGPKPKSALVSVETVSRTNPLVAIDTEFPGDPLGSDEVPGRRQRAYDVTRRNVNATKMVTLGLCFSDHHGNKGKLHMFHFNMKWDLEAETHSAKSVDFFRNHGVDFERLKVHWCDQKQVAEGLRCLMSGKNRKLISFQGWVIWYTYIS